MESTTIRYEFVNGEFTDVEVSNELAQTIRESRREEHNLNERNRYHTAFSLDAGEYEAANLVCDKNQKIFCWIWKITSIFWNVWPD